MSITKAILLFGLVLIIQSVVIFMLNLGTDVAMLIGPVVGVVYGLWAVGKVR